VQGHFGVFPLSCQVAGSGQHAPGLHRKHFRQLQMYHYFIPSHIKLPLTHHHNCKNTFMSFANDTFDHSQVTSHLSQVMFVPCITKRIQQHRVTRRKSLLLMVGCVLSRRPTPVLSQSVKTPMHHMRTQVALKDLARPKVNKYGKKKRD
jgi:hypothetical protein